MPDGVAGGSFFHGTPGNQCVTEGEISRLISRLSELRIARQRIEAQETEVLRRLSEADQQRRGDDTRDFPRGPPAEDPPPPGPHPSMLVNNTSQRPTPTGEGDHVVIQNRVGHTRRPATADRTGRVTLISLRPPRVHFTTCNGCRTCCLLS